MTSLELKEWITSLVQDIEFDYKGKHGSICPFSADNFSLCYDGEPHNFDNVADLMAAKVICGKSLNDISTELDFW